MVLFYCENCGVRVAPEDLDDGTAKRLDESRAVCSTCCSQQRGESRAGVADNGDARELPISYIDEIDDATHTPLTPLAPPASGAQQHRESPGSGQARRVRVTRGVPAPIQSAANKPVSGEFTRRSTQQLPAARKGSSRAHAAPGSDGTASRLSEPNKWLAFGLGASVVLIGALIAILNSGTGKGGGGTGAMGAKEPRTAGKSAEPAPVPASTTQMPLAVAAPEPELPKDPRERDAALLLREAAAYQKANPGDVYGYAERLEELFNAYRMTGAGAEAQRLLKTVQYPDPQTLLAPEAAWAGAENVLSLVDPAKDGVAGKWKKDGTRLTVEPEKIARIQIPYDPPEEYDFRIVFKRVSGEEDVNQMLSARGRALMWSMASAKNTTLGFECIGGKDAENGPASVRGSRVIENDRTYTCVVQVRKRVVRAYLDGKFIQEYKTDYSGFTMRNDWKLKSSRVLGLGAHNSKVIFERAEVRVVSGTGRRVR